MVMMRPACSRLLLASRAALTAAIAPWHSAQSPLGGSARWPLGSQYLTGLFCRDISPARSSQAQEKVAHSYFLVPSLYWLRASVPRSWRMVLGAPTLLRAARLPL